MPRIARRAAALAALMLVALAHAAQAATPASCFDYVPTPPDAAAALHGDMRDATPAGRGNASAPSGIRRAKS